MIKAEVTESSISVFQELNRVDAVIVRQGTEINIQLNGVPVSIMDVLTKLTS